MNAPLDPATDYRKRQIEAEAALVQLDRRAAVLANIRGVLFVGGAVLILLPLFGKLDKRAWLGAAATFVLYAVAAWFHARVLERETRARLTRDLNLRALGRLDGTWRAHPRTGESFGSPSDLTSADLDLFGAGSLFQLISEAVSQRGESRLAQLLVSGGEHAEEIRGMQAAVQELAPRLDFRQALAVETQQAISVGAVDTGMVGWAEMRPVLEPVRWLSWAPYVLPLLSLIAFTLGRMELVWRGAYIPFFLLQLGVVGLTRGPFQEIYTWLSSGERGFARLARAFSLLESQSFQSPHLASRVSSVRSGEQVSASLRQLGRLMAFVEVRQSALMHGALQSLLLWDVLFFFRLERWRKVHGALVRGWLQALAEMEALSSLAAFAHARPQLPYPRLDDAGPRLSATALGHPLLDAPVRNDVRLEQPGSALIITGSNMSGKSTLLRALGVNVVLARAGAPVCAGALALAPLRVVTSMRVKDSLERGVSYFYAEVQRIRDVLQAAQAAPRATLFLLDEMLLGTNARERQLASAQIFRLLLAQGAVGAVTTHDLSFTVLAENTQGRVRNVHFEDQVNPAEPAKLHFDFQLREGIVQTTNALRLLRLSGIPVTDEP